MKLVRLAAWGILAVALTLGAIAWALHRELSQPYWGAASHEVFLDIPAGMRARDIAVALAHAGVIRTSLVFEAYVRWSRLHTELKAGEYRFTAPASPREIAARMVRGEVFHVTVTIPEGLTARETVSLLAHAGIGDTPSLERAVHQSALVRDLDPDARSLEGYLFPDTYRFPRQEDPDRVIATLVKRFREIYSQLAASHPVSTALSVHRVVTLASIVEKEAKLAAERPVIASVLFNRLERGIPLAADPTIIYALKQAGAFDGNLRKRDLELGSPYNTYLRAGLPPGPIANPGEDSLRAALVPARTDYLYYVSRNDGSHEFSRDYQSHARAVARFQPRIDGRRTHQEE
ncbi:MAG: endolytic transglycosylase MltG [Acidobacteria bacterium]|nr:endolytic transglycosylase MltG [Acidobacteriota bacterium]